MTWDQYWYGDPLMVRIFYKAERLRQERVNEEAWLYGAYVSKAIEGTICNAFLETGKPKMSYPDKPIQLSKDADTELNSDTESEDNDALFAKAWMNSFVQAGKNWDKSVVNSDNGN